MKCPDGAASGVKAASGNITRQSESTREAVRTRQSSRGPLPTPRRERSRSSKTTKSQSQASASSKVVQQQSASVSVTASEVKPNQLQTSCVKGKDGKYSVGLNRKENKFSSPITDGVAARFVNSNSIFFKFSFELKKIIDLPRGQINDPS